MRFALALCEVQHLAAVLAIATSLHASEAAASPAIDYAGMMRSTVDSWVASQSTGGLFPYGFDFLADKPTEPDRISPSNLIRQAGAAYTLAAYNQHVKDPRLEEPIRRLLSAFGAYSLPIGKSNAQRWVERTRVLSLPFARWKLLFMLERFGLLYETSGEGRVVSRDSRYGSALTGTVALALLTELVYSNATGDNRFAGLRSAWLQGLLSLRIPGGGFRQTPTSIDDSDYYNGEGWLAVAVYCDLHRDDAQAAATLAELDAALIARYSRKPNPYFYHWGAMAAAQRFATTHSPQFPVFLQNQAELFFIQFQGRLKPDGNNCADMEGLAATLAVLVRSGEGDADLARRIRAWLSSEAAKLPKLQIQPRQVAIALGGEAILGAPRMAEFAGAFLAGVYEPSTRIDAAAHCVSAMIIIERNELQLAP